MNLNKKNPYLIAISGGPDSVFLVHWLWDKGYRNLVLAHVNYHWRKDSDYDQKIVETLSKKLNLPLEIKNLQSHQEKPKKENFEAWARNQRYDFFSSLKDKYHTSHLITGHQKNDLIETFLMQQERSGIVNHYGLAELTDHHDLKIWRPLLNYKKSEITNWLDQNKVPYAVDKTNVDLKFQRNKIRSQLNENDFEIITKKINLSNQVNQKRNKIAQKYLIKNKKDNGLFLQPELKKWDREAIQRLLYSFFQDQNAEQKIIGRKKQVLNEVTNRILQSDKNFWSIDLSGQLLIRDYDFLHILTTKDLPESSLVLKSINDFSKLENFANRAQIITTINADKNQFPYEIRTLIPSKIKGLKWGQKSLANVLGKKKFSYKKRFKTGIIYSFNQKNVLDKWRW